MLLKHKLFPGLDRCVRVTLGKVPACMAGRVITPWEASQHCMPRHVTFSQITIHHLVYWSLFHAPVLCFFQRALVIVFRICRPELIKKGTVQNRTLHSPYTLIEGAEFCRGYTTFRRTNYEQRRSSIG